jgi:oxepin-CoA hydrolase / 3-oxo-5,6-dehydrosuberyl-CoA semialdehyde dehydrogenase
MLFETNESQDLANTGLDNLHFMKPVSAGDAIKVRLTFNKRTKRNIATRL